MWQPDKPETRRSSPYLASFDKGIPTSPSTQPESADTIVAFIGTGVEFKGAISYNGTVRIDGFLDGEIHTEGTLLVGEEAVITAKVRAGTIVCMGKITGDVVAMTKVKLMAPAVLNGGVKTPMLSIEDGVSFNGTLQMTQAVREIPRETSLQSDDDSDVAPLKRANA
ncbi:MAG: polymer-forming cytoskeletal protein [Nitrospira sp.]|nr:MAG: polymer-forming cytoskeletal protein [Nitrospira sp.]